MGGMLHWNCDGNRMKRKDKAYDMSFIFICERQKGGYEQGEGVYGLTREGGCLFSDRAPTSAHWLEPRVGGV